MNTKLTIIEDDPSILLGLETLLKSEGFEVSSCSRGDKAVDFILRQQPQVVILDVMLPGANGFDICKQLRQQKCGAAILMLTAKGQELDKVIGLDSGADDYITKPFGVRELVARIHALLRRLNGRPATTADLDAAAFRIGSNEIDPKSLQLRRGKAIENLTARELKLLQLMHQHAGEVFSRDRLLNEIWGYNYYGTTRTLDQSVVQIRRKLGDPADSPRHLLTIHGVGYKLLP